MKHEHKLKMSCGVTVESTFDDETAQWSCVWTPPYPYRPALRKKVLREYIPWRDAILAEWARKNGKRVMIVTC